MLYAEHILGLRAEELASPDNPDSAATVLQRYRDIHRAGYLTSRTAPKPMGEDGGLQYLDRMAGDQQFVFLSYGPRYRDIREPHLCYGFLFDPLWLIQQGAIVGPDLLTDYEELLIGIIEDIDDELPPLPPIDEEKLAEFAQLMGATDPALLAFIRAESTSRFHDINRAVALEDWSVEGAAEARDRFRSEVGALQAELRFSGAAAVKALSPGMEILIPQVSLDACIGYVEAGALHIIEGP